MISAGQDGALTGSAARARGGGGGGGRARRPPFIISLSIRCACAHSSGRAPQLFRTAPFASFPPLQSSHVAPARLQCFTASAEPPEPTPPARCSAPHVLSLLVCSGQVVKRRWRTLPIVTSHCHRTVTVKDERTCAALPNYRERSTYS